MALSNKQLKMWVSIHLLLTIINTAIQFYMRQWYNNVFYVGSLSWLFAFLIGAYSDGIALKLCRAYFFSFPFYSVFAYVMMLKRGKSLWFSIMCFIDAISTICMFLFLAHDVEYLYWVSVGIQFCHASLFFVASKMTALKEQPS